MEHELNVSTPMSDEMVDDLLNQFLKTVDDDDSTSPIDQRTDEEGLMFPGDGLTSGSDAKQSDGFSSPNGFSTATPSSHTFPIGRRHIGHTSSLDDDEGSSSSNNANANPRGNRPEWLPSAAVVSTEAMAALPGRMFPPGYERLMSGKQAQTSSEDSDDSAKANINSRQSGLRSPSHTNGGRSTHAAPRAGLDVLRNPGAITQQWPPQVPASHRAAEPHVAEAAPPAYATPTNLHPTAWSDASALGAHHATNSAGATQGARVSPPLTAQPALTTPTAPTSFVDPQFFAAMPASYRGTGTAGTGASSNASAPYMVMLPQGPPSPSQLPSQQPLAMPYNPQQQTVMLTMSQLSALLQQQQPHPQPQPPQPPQPHAYQATPYGQMPSQGLPMFPGFAQAAAYPSPPPSHANPATGANPVYMVFAPSQNSANSSMPPNAAPTAAFPVASMLDTQPGYQGGGFINYSRPRAPPQVHALAGQASALSDAPPPQYHDPRHGNDQPRQAQSHGPLRQQRLNDDPHGHRQPGPSRPAKFSAEYEQAVTTDRLPRAPWQLPPRTPAPGNQNRGGGGGGDGNGNASPANTQAHSADAVHAWVRRNGRWQPLVLEAE